MPRRNTLYIFGDMNARLDHRFVKYPCLETATNNSERVADFMTNHNLFSAICAMRISRRQLYTHTGPAEFKSRIDNCLARNHYRSSVLDCKLFTPSAPRSDHRLLMVTTLLRFTTPKMPKPPQRRDCATLPIIVEDMYAEVNAQNITTYEKFANTARTVAELPPKIPHTERRKRLLDNEIVKARKNLDAARQHLRTEYDTASKGIAAECSQKFSELYTQMQENYYNSRTENVALTSHENNANEAFRAINHLTGRKKRTPCGVTGNSPEERTQKLRNHLKELLTAEEAPVTKEVQKVLEGLPIPTEPFTLKN